jgi:hypothetical protein
MKDNPLIIKRNYIIYKTLDITEKIDSKFWWIGEFESIIRIMQMMYLRTSLSIWSQPSGDFDNITPSEQQSKGESVW